MAKKTSTLPRRWRGAARGVSGPSASGYLGGKGLLCAVVLGKLAEEGGAVTAQF